MHVCDTERLGTMPNNSFKLVKHYCLVCSKVVNILDISQTIAMLLCNAQIVETGQLQAGYTYAVRCSACQAGFWWTHQTVDITMHLIVLHAAKPNSWHIYAMFKVQKTFLPVSLNTL